MKRLIRLQAVEASIRNQEIVPRCEEQSQPHLPSVPVTATEDLLGCHNRSVTGIGGATRMPPPGHRRASRLEPEAAAGDGFRAPGTYRGSDLEPLLEAENAHVLLVCHRRGYPC